MHFTELGSQAKPAGLQQTLPLPVRFTLPLQPVTSHHQREVPAHTLREDGLTRLLPDPPETQAAR